MPDNECIDKKAEKKPMEATCTTCPGNGNPQTTPHSSQPGFIFSMGNKLTPERTFSHSAGSCDLRMGETVVIITRVARGTARPVHDQTGSWKMRDGRTWSKKTQLIFYRKRTELPHDKRKINHHEILINYFMKNLVASVLGITDEWFVHTYRWGHSRPQSVKWIKKDGCRWEVETGAHLQTEPRAQSCHQEKSYTKEIRCYLEQRANEQSEMKARGKTAREKFFNFMQKSWKSNLYAAV